MTSNPFDFIHQRLNEIELKLEARPLVSTLVQKEIIDRKELCKRLNISVPTIIEWEKRGKIPTLRLGESVRYNYPDVLLAIECKK